MEKPATTVKRMLKEIKKRKIFRFGSNKYHEEKVKQYVEELAGEDLSMLTSTTLVKDYAESCGCLDASIKRRRD